MSTSTGNQGEVVVDVAVIGGGPAGLSAAAVLGRSRRTVVVIDAGEPRNAPADGVHSFFTRDGTPPSELLAAGRAEVARYGGLMRAGQALRSSRTAVGIEIEVDPGPDVRARRLLVASGLVDELPDLPGLRDRWDVT